MSVPHDHLTRIVSNSAYKSNLVDLLNHVLNHVSQLMYLKLNRVEYWGLFYFRRTADFNSSISTDNKTKSVL